MAKKKKGALAKRADDLKAAMADLNRPAETVATAAG